MIRQRKNLLSNPGLQAGGFPTKEWFLITMILLVTFLVFSPALKNDFVVWDDDQNITLNSDVKELNAANLKDIFSSTITGGYTPLTNLSFAVEIQFFGMKPGVFHFDNILLHLLCTLLVFILLRKLGINLFISFVVTLLFGIHPMRVESVAWISERKDVLYGSFYLLSLISYINYYKSKRLIFYFLALLTFIFGLLSKIQAVSLPLILLLIDYFFEEKFRFRQVLNKIPFFILSLVTGLAGIYILSSQGELETGTVFPFIQRVFIGTYSLCVYIIKSVIPYHLSAIYPYPAKLSAMYYASVLPVIVLAVAIYKSGKHRKELIFGSLFFLFNVILMLQVVGAGQALMADRFTYLAYIGLFFLIAWALNFLYIRKWKPYVIILGAIYVTGLGTLTWTRTQVWKNTETLFSDVIRKYPKVAFAYNNLGIYYSDQNLTDKAITSYGKAIEIKPDGYLSYSNRGEAWFGRGEIGKALEDMNMAIKLKPDYSKAWSNRGAIRGSRKEYDLALTDLNQAISLDEKNLKAYSNRSLVYYSMGNYDQASRDITYYLQTKPGDTDLINLRGLCFNRLNRNQEALADFNRCIQLNPKSGAFYQNRSALLYKMGDNKGALSDILKARELGAKINPDYLKMLEGR